LIGWLVSLAGGFKALAVSMLIPMAEFLLTAAAITVLLIALEDLWGWFNGKKSITGSFLGEWTDFRDRLKLVWEDIKAIVWSGVKFIWYAMDLDFERAGKEWAEAMKGFSNLGESSSNVFQSGQGSPLVSDILAGRKKREPKPIAGTTRDPALNPVIAGFMGYGIPRGSFQGYSSQAPTTVSGSKTAGDSVPKVEINQSFQLGAGTSEQQAREIKKILNDTLQEQVSHSLRHSTPPGK
jgi:hypothetical protein